MLTLEIGDKDSRKYIIKDKDEFNQRYQTVIKTVWKQFRKADHVINKN